MWLIDKLKEIRSLFKEFVMNQEQFIARFVAIETKVEQLIADNKTLKAELDAAKAAQTEIPTAAEDVLVKAENALGLNLAPTPVPTPTPTPSPEVLVNPAPVVDPTTAPATPAHTS